MAIPPSESSSSGSRVPCIGTMVSRDSPGGAGASFGTAVTQQGVLPSVPSQMGSLAAPARSDGRSPSGRRNRSPSAWTRSAWSWTSSQCPRGGGGVVARLGRDEAVADAVPVEREVHREGRRPVRGRGHHRAQKTIRPRASSPAASARNPSLASSSQ